MALPQPVAEEVAGASSRLDALLDEPLSRVRHGRTPLPVAQRHSIQNKAAAITPSGPVILLSFGGGAAASNGRHLQTPNRWKRT